ncbi:MAG: molybdopterin converting factor subunit 1 [Bacteriovoracia bacterium]
MSSIKVKYFASLREKAGTDSEDVSFEGTYRELYEELSKKHDFTLPHEMVQVAVDDEFTSMNALVIQNAKVVFIPPVAGG